MPRTVCESASGTSDGDDDGSAQNYGWLCLKPGDLSKSRAGLALHKECWSACRARLDCIKGEVETEAQKEEIVEKERADMRDDAGQWRQKTTPWLQQGATRIAARQEAKKRGSFYVQGCAQAGRDGTR